MLKLTWSLSRMAIKSPELNVSPDWTQPSDVSIAAIAPLMSWTDATAVVEYKAIMLTSKHNMSGSRYFDQSAKPDSYRR